MNLEFTAAEIAFQDEVRTFLAENLPEAWRTASRGTPSVFVDPDIYLRWQATLHAKGWLAYSWPVEFGGPGWSSMQRYIFERECAIAHAPAIGAQGMRLLAPVMLAFGTPEQQAYFLPRLLSGEHIWCQGYSEPNAGSDLASLRTRAVRDGDSYVVTGSKIWTTNAHFSNWIFCLVRTDPTVKPQQGISFLLIDMASPGLTVRPIGVFSGDRELNEVFFDGVRVPASNMIGAEGQGWTIAKYLLEHERGGTCQAPALRVAVEDLRELAGRTPGRDGKPFTQDRDFMHRLDLVELMAQGMEVFELQQLADLSAGRVAGPKTAMAGLYQANIRQAIDRLALEMSGPAGLELDTARPLYGDFDQPQPVELARIAMPTFLNNRAWSIMAGSSEIMRTIIAKTVLGL